jgi:hypothetical protein
MEGVLREKVEFIDSIVARMKRGESVSIVGVLKEETRKLQRLNREYEGALKKKSVVNKEDVGDKSRYRLGDGSLYVVNRKKGYRCLYDEATKTVTYEFSNGQVERTFPGGIKEIRCADGRVVVKSGEGDYEVLKNNKQESPPGP